MGGWCTTKRSGRNDGAGVPVEGVTDRDPQAGRNARTLKRMEGTGDRDGTRRDLRGDFRAEIREFLGTRRARVTPQQAGLPQYGGDRRRVTGLRREEVALLAGISSEYYTRLERGNATGVSESVIEGIARALQLDEAERMHLVDLLRGAGATRPPTRRPARQRVRPAVQRVLDSMTGAPAFVLSGRGDILAANDLGRALYSPVFADSEKTPNNIRFVFFNPQATEFFREWGQVANDCVAMLRAEAGRDLYDRRLTDLVGELSTRSEEFRRRWAAHDVRLHTTGHKLLHHPVVGDLDLTFETFPIGADDGQALLTYTAEPASASQDALHLLASWAATNDDIQRPTPAVDPEPAETSDQPD